MELSRERAIHLMELLHEKAIHLTKLYFRQLFIWRVQIPRAFPYILAIIFTAFTVIHIQYIVYWIREIVISSK
jgi:hypothetical protein